MKAWKNGINRWIGKDGHFGDSNTIFTKGKEQRSTSPRIFSEVLLTEQNIHLNILLEECAFWEMNQIFRLEEFG